MSTSPDPTGAAPAPWFVVAPPFNEGAPWINAGSADPHDGEFVCDLAWPELSPEDVARTEANAALIVQAVNEYEPLRDIEALIRGQRSDEPPVPAGVATELLEGALDRLDEMRHG